MDFAEMVGLGAGVLTSLSMLPQVLKSHKTKSTRDLSWGYLAVLCTGIALWIYYGFLISSMPIILSNSLNESMVLALAYLKFRYG